MQALIATYAAAGAELRQALAGLSDDDCHARPGPGEWSIHELVIHLQDSDAVGIERMRRVIAEDRPPLIAFDESLFMARLHCASQNRDDAVTLFDVGRQQMARVLQQLSPDDFQRQGVHSEAGPLTLAQLLKNYADHFAHHLGFLCKKRERLGKVA